MLLRDEMNLNDSDWPELVTQVVSGGAIFACTLRVSVHFAFASAIGVNR